MMLRSRYLTILLSLLAIKALCAILLILFYHVHLAPDEAQYWTWSQSLDWGYYSKPPGIAWQIALTTLLFGNTELGVRFGAIVIAFALPLIIFYSARYCELSKKQAFWAATLMAFCPWGIFLSFMATTDGGVTLFFLLATAAVLKGLKDQKEPNYIWAGFWIFCGALYKWVAYAFWPFIFLFLLLDSKFRKVEVLIGIAISLLALLPSLYWNATHEWATFKHVLSTVFQPSGRARSPGNFWEFLGGQIGLLSPIIFILICFAFFTLYRKGRKTDSRLFFCTIVTTGVIFYFFLSLFKKMQINWAAYLYAPGMIVVGAWALTQVRESWIKVGIWSSIILTLMGIAIPAIQSYSIASSCPISYKLNPFRQNMGWNNMASGLEKWGYDPEKDFLFGDKYQTASLLSFYGPLQKRAYFFNLLKMRKNQFSYWPGMEEQELGKTGYFVVLENKDESTYSWYQQHYQSLLAPYFENVEFLGGFPLFKAYGKTEKSAIVFRANGYKGFSPEDPNKF